MMSATRALSHTQLDTKLLGSGGRRHALEARFYFRRLAQPQRELKSRTVGAIRLDPDLSPIALDNLLADGKPNAIARILGASVQPLEDDKNIVDVFGRYADAVVAYAEKPMRVALLGLHGNFGRLAAAELDRVPNQILQELRDL